MLIAVSDKPQPVRVLLSVGYPIDLPGRPGPRFPPAAEPLAAEMIAEAVARECATAEGPLAGLAGGASGGDILFHEAAARLGVPTELCLALPPDEYRDASVADAGEAWVLRFEALCEGLPIRLLPEEAHADPPGLSLWQRNNLWLLDSAFEWSAGEVVLLALWDGRSGDDAGGTADLVDLARDRGARVRLLDGRRLLAE